MSAKKQGPYPSNTTIAVVPPPHRLFRGASTRRLHAAAAQLHRPPLPPIGQHVYVEAVKDHQRRLWHPPPWMPTSPPAAHKACIPPPRAPPHHRLRRHPPPCGRPSPAASGRARPRPATSVRAEPGRAQPRHTAPGPDPAEVSPDTATEGADPAAGRRRSHHLHREEPRPEGDQ
jgi:hypothetical protein